MGVLLIVACVVLAFMCGRLQVEVRRLRPQVDAVEARVTGFETDLENVRGHVELLEIGARGSAPVVASPVFD